MFRVLAHTLTSLLLLAVMAVQLVHVASFEVRRIALRREMKQQIRQGLPEQELVRFAFSPSEYEALEKEDGGREFWVDGHVYDVVRRSTGPDGSIRIEAVDDRDEARLMAGLKQLLEHGMEQRGLGREKARALFAMLASCLPERPLHVSEPAVLSTMCVHSSGEYTLEGTSSGLLRPPRA